MSTSHTSDAGQTITPALLPSASTRGKYSFAKRPTPTSVLEIAERVEDGLLLDARGYKLAKACYPGFHKGRIPKSKGRKYRPTPPDAEEMHLLLKGIDVTGPTGLRLHALMILLWRSGLRISEALALMENDLNAERGTIEVLHGKGDKYRVTGMDKWAWGKLGPWMEYRKTLPIGPVFCVIHGPTSGTRKWSHTDVRRAMKKLADSIGARKRLAPHQLRHAHAVTLLKAGVGVHSIQRQLGHARLDVTQGYFSSIAPEEYLEPIIELSAPTVEM
jgi:site-specific recombinase XerD